MEEEKKVEEQKLDDSGVLGDSGVSVEELIETEIKRSVEEAPKQEQEQEEQKREKVKKIRCFQCNSAQVYTMKDYTIVCRKCGYREKK